MLSSLYTFALVVFVGLMVALTSCQSPPVYNAYSMVVKGVITNQNANIHTWLSAQGKERDDDLDHGITDILLMGPQTAVNFSTSSGKNCKTQCVNGGNCPKTSNVASRGCVNIRTLFEDLHTTKLNGTCADKNNRWARNDNVVVVEFCISDKGIPSSMSFKMGNNYIFDLAISNFVNGEPDASKFQIPSGCPCIKNVISSDENTISIPENNMLAGSAKMMRRSTIAGRSLF